MKVALLQQQRPSVCLETATGTEIGLPYRVPRRDLFTSLHGGSCSSGHHSERLIDKL